jgi:hypothetical protein
MQAVALLLESCVRVTTWLCHQVTPKKGSDRFLLSFACPLLWFLIAVAGLSAAYFL